MSCLWSLRNTYKLSGYCLMHCEKSRDFTYNFLLETQNSHKISTPGNFYTVLHAVSHCWIFKDSKLGTMWKISKYWVFSGPYLDTFHALKTLGKRYGFQGFFGGFSCAIELLFLKNISRWMILNLVWQNKPCKIMTKCTPPYPFYSIFYMNFQKIEFT